MSNIIAAYANLSAQGISQATQNASQAIANTQQAVQHSADNLTSTLQYNQNLALQRDTLRAQEYANALQHAEKMGNQYLLAIKEENQNRPANERKSEKELLAMQSDYIKARLKAAGYENAPSDKPTKNINKQLDNALIRGASAIAKPARKAFNISKDKLARAIEAGKNKANTAKDTTIQDAAVPTAPAQGDSKQGAPILPATLALKHRAPKLGLKGSPLGSVGDNAPSQTITAASAAPAMNQNFTNALTSGHLPSSNVFAKPAADKLANMTPNVRK